CGNLRRSWRFFTLFCRCANTQSTIRKRDYSTQHHYNSAVPNKGHIWLPPQAHNNGIVSYIIAQSRIDLTKAKGSYASFSGRHLSGREKPLGRFNYPKVAPVRCV